MSRKSRYFVKGQPEKRADRPRKRKLSIQKQNIEKRQYEFTSAKKLKTTEVGNVSIDRDIGYRIINFVTVFSALSLYLKCKTCEI